MPATPFDKYTCSGLVKYGTPSTRRPGPLPAKEIHDLTVGAPLTTLASGAPKAKIMTGSFLSPRYHELQYYQCVDGASATNVALPIDQFGIQMTEQKLPASLAAYRGVLKIFGAKFKAGARVVTMILGGGLSWPIVSGGLTATGNKIPSGSVLMTWIPAKS